MEVGGNRHFNCVGWKEELLSIVAQFEHRIVSKQPLYGAKKTPFLKMSWTQYVRGWGKMSDRIKLCPDADIYFNRLWSAIDKAKVRMGNGI